MEALQVIAKYSMVTFAKQQGRRVKGVDDEDAIAVAMKQIKAINPNTTTFCYMHSHKDYQVLSRMYREASEHPEWLLQDSQGTLVKGSHGNYVFDMSKTVVRKWWLDTCLNTTKYTTGDGCYCDQSNYTTKAPYFKPQISNEKKKEWIEGIQNLTREVQTALGDDKLLIGKGPDQPYVKAVQLDRFRANNDSINALMVGVQHGKIMQAHALIGTDCTGDITNYMAAFLIGAGKYSYFGCGEWYLDGNNTEPLTWREEYDKPLGEPERPVYASGLWTRMFSKGAIVKFDTSSNTGEITWGS